MNLLAFVTSARNSAVTFVVLLLIVYGVAPLAIEQFTRDKNVWMELALMASVSGGAILIGSMLPIFDRQFDERQVRLRIDVKYLHITVWTLFALFALVTVMTAPAVPLFSALFETHTGTELDAQRGAFLKGRQGWEAALLYGSTLFTGTFLPYSLARMYFDRNKGRVPATVGFLVYAELFLQKALFIQVVTPIFYLFMQRKLGSVRGLVLLFAACIGLMYMNTVLARGVLPQTELEKMVAQREAAEQEEGRLQKQAENNTSALNRQEPSDIAEDNKRIDLIPPKFFSAKFLPLSSKEHVVWRLVAVPIFTAADAIRLFETKYQGALLMGATSTAIALATGTKRIAYEVEVFAFQWGQNDTAASNSVYFTEAFVNFGWAGLVVFSLVVGLAFRMFAKSSDEGFKAIWPLFAYNISQAGLIGTLLSNGYLLLFMIGLFVTFTTKETEALPEAAVRV